MTVTLLNAYIIVLVILFILMLIIFGFAFARTRHTGRKASSPIPDSSHRNGHTHVDQHDTDVT